MSYVKIGVAGPVGCGKTALIESLSRKMTGKYSMGVSPTIFIQKKTRSS